MVRIAERRVSCDTAASTEIQLEHQQGRCEVHIVDHPEQDENADETPY